MKSLGDALNAIASKDSGKYLSHEWQLYAYRLANWLGDTERMPYYMKIAKNEKRELIQLAWDFVKETDARSRPRLFAWKFKQLKQFSAKEVPEIVDIITADALKIRSKYFKGLRVKAHSIRIFAQSAKEFASFNEQAAKLGKLVDETPTGSVYQLDPQLKTKAGMLGFLEISSVDPNKPQRGYAQFKVTDYKSLKKRSKEFSECTILYKKQGEILEVRDPTFNILLYLFQAPA